MSRWLAKTCLRIADTRSLFRCLRIADTRSLFRCLPMGAAASDPAHGMRGWLSASKQKAACPFVGQTAVSLNAFLLSDILMFLPVTCIPSCSRHALR